MVTKKQVCLAQSKKINLVASGVKDNSILIDYSHSVLKSIASTQLLILLRRLLTDRFPDGIKLANIPLSHSHIKGYIW